jgi:MarR family transcriptional regulator, organic hydroperoxide resistance regulator
VIVRLRLPFHIGAYILWSVPTDPKKALPEVTAKPSGESDYIRSHGNAGVGARLRRLSERIDRESNAVYAHLGLHFEQRWMGVLMLLDERDEMTVGELAEALRITQPSISQTLRSLQAASIVSDKADPCDSRRRIQRLSPKGLQFIEQVRPVWVALMQTARDLDREGIDILTPIDQIEKSLDRKSVLERALGYLANAEGRAKRLVSGRRR